MSEILEFARPEQVREAVAADGAAMFGDGANFSNTELVPMIAETVGVL